MNNVSKKEFINGSIWKIMEKFLSRGTALVFSVILTRLLSADDYGLIALTVVFTNLSEILIDGGFSTALIRKETVDKDDYSCVFWSSIIISSILYILLFFFSPIVAVYYRKSELTSLLRVIGVIFFVQAIASVQTAIVNRGMQFRLLFKCNIIGTIISGIIGIIIALLGFGVWALAFQRILQLLITNILLCKLIKWKPTLTFSLKKIKDFLEFSIGVVTSSFINYMSVSVYSLIIGKKYTVSDLGYYDKGQQLPTQISLYTFGAMSTVLLPTLSSCQSDVERIKMIIRKVVGMTAFLITPMMIGLASVSKELIVLLFTEQWSKAIIIMQWNCLYYWATPFMLINVQIFFAFGHSELRVKTEIIRLVMMIGSALCFCLIWNCGINGITAIASLIAVLSAIVSFIYAKNMIKYSWRELWIDMRKQLFVSLAMGVVLILLNTILVKTGITSLLVSLLLKILVGLSTYYFLSKAFSINELNEILMMLKKLRKRKI